MLRCGSVFNGAVDLMVDQVSLMPDSARKNGGFRTDLYEAFAGLKPTVMRWPGGCYGEEYRWKYGIGGAERSQQESDAVAGRL